MQVLEEMAAEGMELSSKFWVLLGKQQQSQQMAEVEAKAAKQKKQRVSAKRARHLQQVLAT
eukprot:1718416-Pleurochrysis_carterae.AAC.1